jgi:glutathione synthase/RimK-type ligase-like ATP-grasp enzyme
MDRRVLVTDSLWDFKKSDRMDLVMEVNSDCPSSRVKLVPADVAAELAEYVEALSSAWGLESVLF